MSGATEPITLEATLDAVDSLADDGAPVSTSEVAGALGCVRRTAYGKLDALAERGDLRTKKVGARARVWWLPAGGPPAPDRGDAGDLERAQFEELVGAVADYAIFVLDAEGRVRTWNDGARRIKGYEESEIVGRHVSAFYTEAETAEGVPDRNLARAAEAGRVEDEGPRVRRDGSTFRANVVITALHDDDGDLRGYVKVTRDMTERHEYEQRLRAQRDELDELDRINAVIRDVDQALVTATTRADIDRAVCERLAASEAYAAAWIGEVADASATPREWAGLPDVHVEDLGAGDSPAARAAADALADGSVRTVGLDGGAGLPADVEAAVAIPLVYEETGYGVLAVYASADVDDRERSVLGELGETISHAVAAIRRKGRERTLTALQASSRELLRAESPAAIGDVIVDAVTGDLALADAAVYRFDTTENRLEPASASFPVGSDDGTAPPGAVDDAPVWECFVAGEPRTVDAAAAGFPPTAGPADRPVRVLPLGDHGVLAVAAERGGFDERTERLVGLVGATAEAALERVETQANLRERDEILKERNQRLQRLNGINEVIRGVDQALIRASTRADVERVVCRQLADADRFRFAWIGAADGEAGLEPRAWSGEGRGYLDAVAPGEADGGEPAGRAARTGDVAVVENVADDLRSGPWRAEAFRREFQTAIGVPLVHESVTHGVLAVYAERPGVFGEMEREVFAELGETIAYTLDAVETRQSLASDARIELEFEFREASTSFLVRLAGELEGEVAYEGYVPLSEDRGRLFLTAEAPEPEPVLAAIEGSVAAESARAIASHDGGHLVEAVVTGPTVPSTLAALGASLRSLVATGDGARVVVDLPTNADVRTFIERFRSAYERAEFLARRRRERPVGSRAGVRAELEERLTDRQLEVLRTAYFGGYFASPRLATGGEIAEVLGVSQPTVTEHLRAAQEKLLGLLLPAGPEHATGADQRGRN